MLNGLDIMLNVLDIFPFRLGIKLNGHDIKLNVFGVFQILTNRVLISNYINPISNYINQISDYIIHSSAMIKQYFG
jgi:hypothetical protein